MNGFQIFTQNDVILLIHQISNAYIHYKDLQKYFHLNDSTIRDIAEKQASWH